MKPIPPTRRIISDVVYDVPESLPDVTGNPDRTQQVLIALLDNAFKYTPEGGTVTLSAAVEGDVVRIRVRDTGVGISKETCRTSSTASTRSINPITARERAWGLPSLTKS